MQFDEEKGYTPFLTINWCEGDIRVEIDEKKYKELLLGDPEINLNDINKPRLKGLYGRYKGNRVYILTERFNIAKLNADQLVCVRILYLDGGSAGNESLANVEQLEAFEPDSLSMFDKIKLRLLRWFPNKL